MASQPQAGRFTRGVAARAPPPASVEGPAYRATVQRCVALVDWWLVRGEDDKIRVAGYPERNRAARLFYSDSITMRHADGTLETADHKILLIRGPLNITQMHCNGFPYEVSKNFRRGFPDQWEQCANSNMKQMNENTQSPSKSTEYYIEKFLRGSFINSAEYSFMEADLKSSKGPTGNTDGPPSQGLSDLSNGIPKIQEPTGNGADYHNSVSITTASEGLCNGRIGMPDESCEDTGPGETYSGRTSQAAKPRELQVLAKGLSPAFGLQCSKDNTGRRPRSGKVCEMSNGASFKKGNSKRKTMQHETLNVKVDPIEETRPPSDPTCHENGSSVAQIPAADELQSQHSGHKGRGRPRKRARTEEL
ncbi:uncharacterized protein LOC124669694 [Lolium rigidum]|uniref:uncharacterized protein LOC124669694 n=1 Tax=Lolium rigidum TaxID=89674 RepID=UPI001F5DEE67|nr:uncharacterized protein LOC124669694 [Lolium rigidum]